MISKRIFDIVVSFIGLILISPLFIILIFVVITESRGGALYKQVRVGQHNKDFKLLKFRSMFVDSDKQGLLTVGNRDSRITKSGYFLRKYKFDELPQLINVLKGDMSFVGPRPEVRKYVDLYDDKQLKVLDVKPGITDYASIKYADENSVLAEFDDPEKAYIEKVMPDKLSLNLKYVSSKINIFQDVKLILSTLKAVVSK